MPNPSYIPFGGRVITAGGLANVKHKLNGIEVINKTGSDIDVNKLVAVVGYDTTAELPKIVLADADVSTHKEVYVTLRAIANNTTGTVWKGGRSTPVLDTNSATAAGDPVYLSATAGAFTHTAPATGQASVLPVGWVTVKSASVGEIHWHIGEIETAGNSPAEVVAATNVITAAESGATFFLDAATEFVSTLPAPALGLKYTFIVTNAPETASYTVVTTGAAEIMIGRVFLSAGSGADGDTEDTAGGTTLTFVDGAAVIGDMAEFWSDGTNWYVRAFAKVSTGITITG